MSYNLFRNISGMDNLIDRGEYGAYYQSNHPFTHPYINSINASREFTYADRNRDNRLDYFEFAAGPRTNGYFPGSYTFGYGY